MKIRETINRAMITKQALLEKSLLSLESEIARARQAILDGDYEGTLFSPAIHANVAQQAFNRMGKLIKAAEIVDEVAEYSENLSVEQSLQVAVLIGIRIQDIIQE